MSNRKPRPPKGNTEHDILYGVHAVINALANPRRDIVELLVTENTLERNEPALRESGVNGKVVAPSRISALLPPEAVHQGIYLKTKPLPTISLEDLPPDGIVVILDQITDPHNVGAIMRTCAAFAVAGIITTTRHSPAPDGVLAKTASGAVEHVPYIRVTNLARAMNALQKMTYTLVGLDSSAPQNISTTWSSGGTALVLGAEGKGLRRLTRENCDAFVRLDMPGAIKSLNVSNAAAVALYALHQHRTTKP